MSKPKGMPPLGVRLLRIADDLGLDAAWSWPLPEDGSPDIVLTDPAGLVPPLFIHQHRAAHDDIERDWRNRALAVGGGYIHAVLNTPNAEYREALGAHFNGDSMPRASEDARSFYRTHLRQSGAVKFAPLPDNVPISREDFPDDWVGEKQLQKEIIALAEALGIWVYSVPDSRRVHGRGFPDVYLLGTELIHAELKGSDGYMREDQIAFETRANAAGQTFYLWKPSDYFSGDVYRVLYSISPIHWPEYADHLDDYPVPEGWERPDYLADSLTAPEGDLDEDEFDLDELDEEDFDLDEEEFDDELDEDDSPRPNALIRAVAWWMRQWPEPDESKEVA